MSPARALPLPNSSAPAGRANLWLALAAAMLNLPVVTAVLAIPTDGDHPKSPSFDVEGRAGYQGLRYFPSAFGQDSLEGRTRYGHLLGGVLLVAAFQIGQAQRFQFLVEQGCALQGSQRYAHGLVDGRMRLVQ